MLIVSIRFYMLLCSRLASSSGSSPALLCSSPLTYQVAKQQLFIAYQLYWRSRTTCVLLPLIQLVQMLICSFSSTWRVEALVITGDGGGTAHEAPGYYSWKVRTKDYFKCSDLQVLPESWSFHHYFFQYLHQSIICERVSTTQQHGRTAR